MHLRRQQHFPIVHSAPGTRTVHTTEWWRTRESLAAKPLIWIGSAPNLIIACRQVANLQTKVECLIRSHAVTSHCRYQVDTVLPKTSDTYPAKGHVMKQKKTKMMKLCQFISLFLLSCSPSSCKSQAPMTVPSAWTKWECVKRHTLLIQVQF